MAMDRCLQVAWFDGKQAIAEQTNFIFSPLSLRAGLSLLAAGAHGATLRQLLDFLGSEHTAHLDAATAALHARMRSWPQFASAAASDHAAVARSADFRSRPAAAAAEVNAFIEQATAGRIRNLIVSPDAVKGNGKVVLSNGMHFKATWARRFDPADTVHDLFHLGDGYTSVRVPFLSDAGVQYAETFDAGPGFKVLQCFYKMTNREGRLDPRAPCFCMLVFLPHRRDGLAALLRLAVTEPDFVMRSGSTPGAPFNPDDADLSRMVANAPPEGLYVSAVGVACAVEVDEEGTTAVACMYGPTSPGYSPCDSPPPPPMSFVADHAFMFAIVEYEKAEVLFLGHVMDPSKET
ncbi:hypothetical protein PR202_gb14862 [Eleusine coracana subsp. coracana]|uniref:Serpin domain-containing protein n=1 Tax=Eleusine coracana subsp. coracana TaxID=191504 RepID=A0AAV5EXI0_ELECO|nr:hypothetical protein PR202_gb14862 [Eleusine coracana subsp. coracana]